MLPHQQVTFRNIKKFNLNEPARKFFPVSRKTICLADPSFKICI